MKNARGFESVWLSIGKFGVLIAMMALSLAVAVNGADETYYQEDATYFDMTLVSGTCDVCELTNESWSDIAISRYAVTDNDVAFVATDTDVYYTLDGLSYTSCSGTFTGNSFDIFYDSVGELFISTSDGHIWRSQDDCSSFSDLGMFDDQVNSLIEFSGSIFAGTYDDGKIYETETGFDNWTEVADLANSVIWDMETDGTYLYAVNAQGDVFRSDTEGHNWITLANVSPAVRIRDLVIYNSSNFYAFGGSTSGRVWESTNSGASWSNVETIAYATAGLRGAGLHDGVMYVGATNVSPRVYKSTNFVDYTNMGLELTGTSTKIVDIESFLDGILISASDGATQAVSYYLRDGYTYTSVSLQSLCGEFKDYNDDGIYDLVGWKMNDTNSSTLWSIYKNLGNNTHPVYSNVYNFTEFVRGDKINGRECVASVDIDGDDDLDYLVYDLRAEDSTNMTEDVKNKTGNKGFFKNYGTAENTQLVLDDTLVTPYYDISIPVDYRFISCSEIGNCGGAGLDYNYNYLPKGFPTTAKLLANACSGCGSGYCDYATGCYGSISYGLPTLRPFIQFQFFDYDGDGDSDLYAGMNNNWGTWYENIGTIYHPRFVPQIGWLPFTFTSYDANTWVDFDGDTVPDRIGGFWGAPLQGTARILMFKGDYWLDNITRDYVHNVSWDYTVPFSNDNVYEPIGYGYSVSVVWVGDLDGDTDADIITVENRATGNRLVLYESQGVGLIVEPEVNLVDDCAYPCIIDEDFQPYPDGFSINNLPEWVCDSSVTVESGTLIISGSESLARCCVDMNTAITTVGTVDFYINPNSECKFSSYNNGFNQLSVLHEWDNVTSSNYVYHYIGNLLGKLLLRDFVPDFWQRWTGVYYIPEDLELLINAENFSLSLYDGTDAITGVNKLCWNAETAESVCKLDDLLVYVGTDRLEDTTGDLRENASYECYAGFCYLRDDVLADSRPTGYTPQTSYIGGAFFDYNRCIEEGFNPNQLCIIRLAWKDGMATLRNFFISNIVPIFILILIITVLAITVLHNRRGK